MMCPHRDRCQSDTTNQNENDLRFYGITAPPFFQSDLSARRNDSRRRGRVFLREPIPGVRHGEAAIVAGGQLDVMTGITVPGEIRDELLCRIDLFAYVVRVMELPEVLEPRGALDNLKRPGPRHPWSGCCS